MASLLVWVLIVLGLFVGVGWFFGARSARRGTIWPQDVPPPAAVYAEGFEAGFRAGLGAQDAARTRGAVVTPTEAVPAPSSPRADPPSSVQWSPPSSPRPGPSEAGGAGPWIGPPFPDGFTAGRRDTPAPQVLSDAAPVAVPLSAEERAAAKAARDLRTINIALYSASLLLVAAGGLFIGAAVPGVARAVTICAVVALFYVSGLILHARLPRLRPAAIAFAGTGLALLPVAGLLFGVLTGEGSLAWFGTALIGTVAYLVAAVRLRSRVVAYLSLPFFLSIALSSVSLIGGALVWYFTCSIAVAALLAVLVDPAPRWLPVVLTRAVLDAHRVLTPLALTASLLLGSVLTPGERALLWVVATVYYASLLVFVPVRRVQHFYALRLVATLATAFTGFALELSFPWVLLALALWSALQVSFALAVPAPLQRLLRSGTTPQVRDDPDGGGGRAEGWYRTDVLVTFALLTLVAATAAVSGSGVRDAWPGGTVPAGGPDVLLPVLLVSFLGMWIAVRFGGVADLLVLPGLLLGVMVAQGHPWRTEIVVALSIGYFLVRAGKSGGRLRERFVIAARAGGAVLVPLAVLVHLRGLDLPVGVLGEIAVLSFVLAAVANQLAEVLRVRRARGTGYGPWLVCAAGGLSLLGVGVLAASGGEEAVARIAIWSTVLAGSLTTLGLPLAGEGAMLRRPGEGSRPLAVRARCIEAVAPVSLIVAAMAGAVAGLGYRFFEALLAVVVVHAAMMARRTIDRRRRGVYLLAAQISFTTLTAVLAADLDLSIHAGLTVVAVGIALQELVRVILRRRLRDLGLQASSAWLSIAALVGLPLFYGALAGPTAQLGVVVVHLTLLLAVAAILFLVQRRETAAYPALYAVAALIAVLSGVLRTTTEGWLARAPLAPWGGALVAVTCLLALVVVRVRTGRECQKLPILVGAGVLALEACVLAFPDGTGWERVVVAAVIAASLFALSRRETVPWLDAAGAFAVIVLSTVFVEEVTRGATGLLGAPVMQTLLGAVLAAGVLHLARDLLPMDDHGELRYRILGVTALAWAAVAALAAMVPADEAVAGSVVLGVVAVLTLREVPVRVRAITAELVFLVLVAAIQRITWVFADGMSLFWAAQWWVVALALLAGHSFVRGSAARGPRWLAASAAILSGAGLLTLAGGTAGAQVWSLCGHVALVLAGVALSRRLFSTWGAVGIVLALLWFLRGYTFLLLTVAALALLAFAIWKLNSQTRGSGGAGTDPPREAPRGGSSPGGGPSGQPDGQARAGAAPHGGTDVGPGA